LLTISLTLLRVDYAVTTPPLVNETQAACHFLLSLFL